MIRTRAATERRARCGAIVAYIVTLALVLAWGSGSSRAQSQSPADNRSTSDLDHLNLSRVSASATDIKGVLIQDSGLMIELKRWVAEDAANHGQIVGESDLSDDAIFDRLETDVQFRAIATRLLQRYGYFVPKPNPDSLVAHEQALLLQERAKQLAQQQNEPVANQQGTAEDEQVQRMRACSAGYTQYCQQQNAPAQGTNQPSRVTPTPVSTPDLTPNAPVAPLPLQQQPSAPGLPAGNRNGSLETASLMESDDESQGSLSFLGFGEATNNSATRQDALSGYPGLSSPMSASSDEFGQGNNNSSSGPGLFQSGSDGFSMSGGFHNRNQPVPLVSDSIFSGSEGLQERNPPTGLEALNPSFPAGTPVAPLGSYTQTGRYEGGFESVLSRVPDPYKDIPSLYDMYLQASPRPSNLHRFGIDVFENGIRDPQLIPMDLPAGPDYVVGPGDGLAIDLWGGVSQRFYRTVDREGRVSLPEVGPVLVSGKSLADVQDYVQKTLRTQYREVSADVTLARLRTIRVYEVGEVQRPGAYDISSLSTPLNALFAAGGPTARGSLRLVKHFRGDHLVQVVDLYDLLLHGVKTGIAPLENGDTVLVPTVGSQVAVEGMVRRPGIYELKNETSLASVLELAGGLLPAATLRHTEVQRLVAHDKQTMLSVDVPETDGDAATTQKLEAFQVQDGDRIRIFPVAPYNQDAIYLEGHVLRPGRYSYHDGMRVTDLIASYKDLLPEPSLQYAEIIRLDAPDFHPSVESFDLADALQNPSSAPILHPLDTVRIFSRFDFENPPVVSVLGDVRQPGTYQTSGEIHLSDAVHLAHGLAPDAQTADAQVFRPLPDGQVRVLDVNLSEAIAGVASANIVLEPRDRILVHRSPDALEPATVFVEGAVERPGRYPLTTNMTIAELIRTGGGLTPGADTQTADLTTYEWSGGAKLDGQQTPISIAAALKGDANADVPLHNGDVVTVRQIPGWGDLGASISVRGEVKHPGKYGITPGERLSSIIERAGGFESDAYPYGAILQRVQVRQLESKERDELILRVKEAETGLELMPENTPEQKQTKEGVMAQYRTTLAQLNSTTPLGRVTIQISSNTARWRNTTADIQVQAGDVLIVPKKPSYVMVTGQVYNATAVSYRPGKSARWYLSQSGGPTPTADKKAIFVIRADGSVIGGKKAALWDGDSLSAALRPGDTVVVPERALGGGPQWQSIFSTASIAGSIVSTAIIAARY